jgi:uncharacterized membrane protein
VLAVSSGISLKSTRALGVWTNLPLRRLLLIVLLAAAGAYFVIEAVQDLGMPNAGVHDFGVYYRAAVAVAHGRAIYSPPPPCCFNPAAMTGYTYPPLFAALVVPFTVLPVDDAGRLWLVISYVALLVILYAGVRAAPRPLSTETILWLAFVVLAASSVGYALYEMQATPLVVALEAVYALCIIRGRFLVAGGACLALAVALKLSPLLIAPALLLLPRSERLRALGGLGGGLAVAALVSLLASPQTLDYVTHVLPSFSSGVVSPNNLSLPGVVLRALSAAGIAPSPRLGELFLLLEVAALVLTWALCHGIGGADGRALMIAGLLAVTPIVQGVTWDHHLIGDLLALILLAPFLHRWTLPWVLAAGGTLVATANRHPLEAWVGSLSPHPATNALTFTVFVAAAAFNLAGMCALWVGVILTARRMRLEGQPSRSRNASRRPRPWRIASWTQMRNRASINTS